MIPALPAVTSVQRKSAKWSSDHRVCPGSPDAGGACRGLSPSSCQRRIWPGAAGQVLNPRPRPRARLGPPPDGSAPPQGTSQSGDFLSASRSLARYSASAGLRSIRNWPASLRSPRDSAPGERALRRPSLSLSPGRGGGGSELDPDRVRIVLAQRRRPDKAMVLPDRVDRTCQLRSRSSTVNWGCRRRIPSHAVGPA